MVKISNALIQCADCRKYRCANEPLCPDCGSERRIINAGLHESLNVSDRTTTSVAVSASTIDVPSASISTTTTIIPPSIIAQPKEQRNFEASQLVIKNNKSLEGSDENLPEILSNIVEGKQESYILKKDNKITVFNNCSFYGSTIGGDIHSVDMTFIEEWNQIQDSIDIEELKRELETLRHELSKRAIEGNEGNEYEAAAQISAAYEDLTKANGPSMLKRIRNSGDWVFGVAKDVGVSLIAELIKKSMS